MLPRFFGIWEVLPETIADMIFISAFFIPGLHLIRADPDMSGFLTGTPALHLPQHRRLFYFSIFSFFPALNNF